MDTIENTIDLASAIETALQQTKYNQLKPFFHAINSKKVSESSKLEIVKTLSLSLTRALIDLGHRAKPLDEYELLIETLLEIIEQDFQVLTLDEIKLACKLGSYGIYGDVFGVNTVQVLKWLRAFENDPCRDRALFELTKILFGTNIQH